MGASRCKQYARLRALASHHATAWQARLRSFAAGSDIVRFEVTSRHFCATSAGIALACCVELASAHSQGHRPLLVSFAPATLHPGDVARVNVGGVNADERITGSVLGQNLAFHYDEREQIWRALIGIDLDTKAGAYRLQIRRDAGAGAVTRRLNIVPKQFRVRRLRVPGGFVDPPPEALAQIAQDSASLTEAYARVTPRQWSGPFVLPVDGDPTSNFGTRSYYNGQRRSPHAGVDFVGEPGTPVRAANRGRVVVSAPMYFTGNTIVIDYGDRLFSVFAHLSELHAKVGDTVEPTTIVGLVGATGRVTGPHLHWSVRLNGARVDPLSLVAATAHDER
jgi:murein DD-endopeptidase MepM/ murein hydrolase activator NlpD